MTAMPKQIRPICSAALRWHAIRAIRAILDKSGRQRFHISNVHRRWLIRPTRRSQSETSPKQRHMPIAAGPISQFAFGSSQPKIENRKCPKNVLQFAEKQMRGDCNGEN